MGSRRHNSLLALRNDVLIAIGKFHQLGMHVNWTSTPYGQSYGVTRPGIYHDLLATPLEVNLGVENALPGICDYDLFYRPAQVITKGFQEVVGQRTWGCLPLQGEGYGLGLKWADADRQDDSCIHIRQQHRKTTIEVRHDVQDSHL